MSWRFRFNVLVGLGWVLGGAALAVATPMVPSASAGDVAFGVDALIIPMDTTWQDNGMLSAYGLVDALLRAGVTVDWCILPGKTVSPAVADFTASARDLQSNAVITAHNYRGGPFVIAAADAGAALPIIIAWQATHAATKVHVATQPFTAPVRLVLTAAPRIAVLADGNQSIIFSYLNAAGIPDEAGLAWGATSVDLLTPLQVTGASVADPADGALFRASGLPAFSVLASGHWSAASTDVPKVVPELEAFLQFPVLVFAECQSVLAIENAAPAGGFLTTAGVTSQSRPASVRLDTQDSPFLQMDGTFQAVNGSEAAYGQAAGGAWYANDNVMIRSATSGSIGLADVWIAGYFQGTCALADLGACDAPGPRGKVAYLAGHQYATTLPISASPTTQGTRLFLNALLAGSVAHAEGQPAISLGVAAPESTMTASLVVTLTAHNAGPGPALGVRVDCPLPARATFVSATGGGTCAGDIMRWDVGDLAAGASVEVEANLALESYGAYATGATAVMAIGLTPRTVAGNSTTTIFADPASFVPPEALSRPTLTCFPSPGAGDLMTLRFMLPREEPVTVALYDVRGRMVWSRDAHRLGEGWHTLDLEAPAHLPSGTYVVRLSTPSGQRTAKVTVAR